MEVVEELADRPKDYVPSYPLGTKHEEFAKNFGIPFEATQGGSETLYPDYIPKLRQMIKGETPAKTAFKIPGTVANPAAPPVMPKTLDGPADEIAVIQVRPNIHMLVGDGAHVTVQTGKDGVLVVDSGEGKMTPKLLAAVRTISNAPLRYLVLTHAHKESTGGTLAVVAAGGPRTNATGARSTPANVDGGVATVAHENVNQRLSLADDLKEESLPTSTFYSERKDIYFNGEAIELLSVPKAHTDGDILVFFRASDVVAAGGVLDTTHYPHIDAGMGGSLQGTIMALTKIIELTVPERNQMGGTLVIPAHGRLSNEADIVEYRNMVIIVRDRIRDMVRKGMTLEQVKAARPTLDYDALYGTTTGEWTTEMFIAEAYKELSAAAQGAK
jgi:cyclase